MLNCVYTSRKQIVRKTYADVLKKLHKKVYTNTGHTRVVGVKPSKKRHLNGIGGSSNKIFKDEMTHTVGDRGKVQRVSSSRNWLPSYKIEKLRAAYSVKKQTQRFRAVWSFQVKP